MLMHVHILPLITLILSYILSYTTYSTANMPLLAVLGDFRAFPTAFDQNYYVLFSARSPILSQ